MATVRPEDLHRSITNPVENAVRFGAEVTIRLGVLAHGGELSLHDRQPNGLIVRVQLPVHQSRQSAA